MKAFISLVFAAILIGHSANAGSATATLAANKASPLQLVITGVMADCSWAPGTKVLTFGTAGGDGKAVTYAFGGSPTGDFAISGNTLVVGPTGIAAANCGTMETISIIGTQL
jgi:hypothetical protein